MSVPEIVKEIIREKVPATPRNNNNRSTNNNTQNQFRNSAPNVQRLEKLSKQLSVANERNRTLQSELKNSKTLTREVKAFKSRPAVSKASAAPSAFSEDFVRDDFTSHGNSKYLNSLLVPEDGPCTIPDQVLKMHVIKTETVTYQIDMVNDLGSGSTDPISGLFMLYPNHPTELIGYVFIRQSDLSYKCVKKMITAQQLYESFDYGRRTSQILKIQSSTLPSGMYAINGTFNAVRVDGTPSEMGFTPLGDVYANLLQNTSYGFDKIGNVSVGNGISVLTIPDSFAVPYTRLNDSTPFVQVDPATPAYTNPVNEIADAGLDLRYIAQFQTITLPAIAAGVNTGVFSYALNIDSTTGVDVQLDCSFTSMGAASVTLLIGYTVEFFDPFGNPVTTIGGTQYDTIPVTQPNGNYNANFHGVAMINGSFEPNGPADSWGPIAAAVVTVQVNPVVGAVSSGGDAVISITMTALNGKASGINAPVTYVAFESVAAHSTITVAGISNFELIPNPELRKNIVCSYGKYDPSEIGYVEAIVSRRDKYLIRSVYDSVNYASMKETFRALADCRRHSEISQSFGWSDLLGIAKRSLPFIANVTKAIAPVSAPLVDSLQNMYSKSASGLPFMAKAASGIGFSRAGDTTFAAALAKQKNLKTRRLSVSPVPRVYNHYRRPAILPRYRTSSLFHKSVAFPTVETDLDDRPIGTSLWIVTQGDFSKMLPPDTPVFTSPDGHKVIGLHRAGGLYTSALFGNPWPLNTKSDVTFLRIDPLAYSRTKSIKVIPSPMLSGHSCDAAIWLLANGDFSGLYPLPVSGEITFKDGKPVLLPNPLYTRKADGLAKYGIPLLAANATKQFAVSDLLSLKQPSINLPDSDFVKISRACACDTEQTLKICSDLKPILPHGDDEIVEFGVAPDALLSAIASIEEFVAITSEFDLSPYTSLRVLTTLRNSLVPVVDTLEKLSTVIVRAHSSASDLKGRLDDRILMY